MIAKNYLKIIKIVLFTIVKLIVGNLQRIQQLSSFNFQLIDFFTLQRKWSAHYFEWIVKTKFTLLLFLLQNAFYCYDWLQNVFTYKVLLNFYKLLNILHNLLT